MTELDKDTIIANAYHALAHALQELDRDESASAPCVFARKET